MHHHHDPADHDQALGFVTLFNLIITIAEFAGGILSGSLALLSDAVHNLSDVLALLLGYLGEKAGKRAPDLDYSFGLRRMEVITAFINALALIVVGGYIFIEAIKRAMNPAPIDLSIMLPVACIGLAGNLLSIIFLRTHRDTNLNLKAAFLHLLYDTLSSVAVITVGVVLIFVDAHWLDPLISLVIVIMMAASSADILRESLRIVLQIAPGDLDTSDVLESIINASGGCNVHGLHIWSVNSNETFLSCHIRLDPQRDSDELIRTVNEMLSSRYAIDHTTIQVERDQLCPPSGCCPEHPAKPDAPH